MWKILFSKVPVTVLVFSMLCSWLITCPATAQDDRSLIIKALGYPVDDITIHKSWALLQWSDGDAAGQAIFHRLDGRWIKVAGGGGAFDAGNLFRYGVPKASWEPLLKRKLSPAEIGAVEPGPYWIDWIRRVDLRDTDLENDSDWQLTLMRNEIFAVHGRPFRDPELRAYFGQRSWYHPDPSYSDARLTPRELGNARKIASFQASRSH